MLNLTLTGSGYVATNPGVNAGGGRSRMLRNYATRVTHTGTLVETVLYSMTIPGGTLGPNGALSVSALWGVESNARVKNLKIKYGGTAFQSINATTNTIANGQYTLQNRGSLTSQIGGVTSSNSGAGNSTAAIHTGAIDTSVDQLLEVTGLLLNVADTIYLERFMVEILNPGV